MKTVLRMPIAGMLSLSIVLICSSGIVVEGQNVESESSYGSPLKVMSFNIRFGKANDGDNHWDRRQELVAETIKLFSPDLLGLQEALDFQCQFLESRLPEYKFFGRSRELNPVSGEFCGIFFRPERFELVDSGHFWLSDEPDQPGSMSWDSSLPRMVSWVRLRDQLSDNAEFVFANTHFDHRGPQARLQAAKLIRQRLVDDSEMPLVLTGDFNCGIESEPYNELLAPSGPKSKRVLDSYRTIHPESHGQDGSFSAWTGETNGPRIDWVLHTDSFITLNADIDHTRQNGRFPSDHYPVTAILKPLLPGAKK